MMRIVARIKSAALAAGVVGTLAACGGAPNANTPADLKVVRASAKGIVQTTDLVPMGIEGGVLNLLHHPTATFVSRTPDWVVLAVPQNPVERLYHELKAVGVSVQRVGDCVAPRRAHAAVVDGERAGAAV